MKRHLVFFYWLLLLVSTLAIGGVTFYLLQRESDRLRNMASDSAIHTGRIIAFNLKSQITSAKTASMDALSKLPEVSIGPQMMDLWKDSIPAYARNVFLYDPVRGLELPFPDTPERDLLEPLLRNYRNNGWVWNESQTQLQRSAMLANYLRSIYPGSNPAVGTGSPPFNRNIINANGVDQNGIASSNDGLSNQITNSGVVTDAPDNALNFANNTDLVPSQVAILHMSNSNGITTTVSLNGQASVSVTTGNQGQLVANSISLVTSTNPGKPEQNWAVVDPRGEPRWLGWIQNGLDGPVRGLLLSWEAMEKSMNAAFPEHLDAADGFVLKNPARKAVIAHFANGALVLGGKGSDPVDDPAAIPAFAPIERLQISPEMPGWSLEVYFNPEAKFSSHFMALSTVLVTVLVISVLVGGTLLMREARREAFDAARKTSFVSNVSHELKTPLTTIRMYAELLGEGRVRDPAKQRNYLTTIINESQRLTRLVNNVLDFSRLEQGRKKYNLDNVSLAEVVRSVLDAQRPRLEEAGFQVDTDLATAGDLHIQTDRDALEQVLLNLMDNALKYAADGHWLGVNISRKENQAVLTISDRGPGVPTDEQEKIFEMFHRVDDSITARLPGAGLGLSIARRLLRDQEGDLRYEPNPGGGASFVASLPLSLAGENAPPPPAEASLAAH